MMFNAMTDLHATAKSISAAISTVKSGPIRLWGEPWGRPGENGLSLAHCEAAGNCLRLGFKGDVELTVWNPTDVQIDASRCHIGSATAMRLTWYYGDRPKLAENILYREYSVQGRLISFRTNEHRTPGSGTLHESAIGQFPAVEIAD